MKIPVAMPLVGLLLVTAIVSMQGAQKPDRTKARLPEAADQFSGPNYVVVDWKRTELQMAFGSAGDPQENSKAYVLIDGNSLYGANGKLDQESMNWNQLAEQLRPFSDRKNGIVEFSVHNFAVSARDPSFLGWTLEGFGRQRAGYAKAYVSQSFRGAGDFWTLIDAAREKMKGRAEGPELSVGDELVKAYPVETFISCIKSGNADCVVIILPRLEANSGDALPPAILKSIFDNVQRIQTPQKNKLQFLVSHTLKAKPTIDWLTKIGTAELAKSLSFESAEVHSVQY